MSDTTNIVMAQNFEVSLYPAI